VQTENGRKVGEVGMNHAQFAKMTFENGEVMLVNTQYITAFGYIKGQDKTVIAILGEGKEVYFPGNQTHEIKSALNCVGRSVK